MFDQLVALKEIFYLLAVFVLEVPDHFLGELCQRDLIFKNVVEDPLNCITIGRELNKVVH